MIINLENKLMIKLKMEINPKKKVTRITINTVTAVEFFEVVDNIFDFYATNKDKYYKHIKKLYKDVLFHASVDHVKGDTMTLTIILEGVVDYTLTQLKNFVNKNNFNKIVDFDYKLKILN
jgi:hypothetical protein